MATLLLTRHGETDWNATQRWQGFTGPRLNELGRRQAERLAAELVGTNIGAIYSSDTIRSTETAEIVAERLGLDVRQDTRLREVNFGEWEGLTRQEINERYAGAFSEWDACKLAAPTGGETDLEMAARVLEAVTEIAHKHKGEKILVVTSGGPIRAVQAHAQRIDQGVARLHLERAENCAVFELKIEGNSFTLDGARAS
jgi:broad specificity phosphatase PhoE